MRSLIFADVLFFNSGQRSDCVWKMTVDQFENGVWNGDVFVVTVLGHKTASTHGGAALPIQAPVKNLVDVYLKVIRPIMVAKRVQFPEELKRDAEGQLRHILETAKEPEKTECVFVSINNKPIR